MAVQEAAVVAVFLQQELLELQTLVVAAVVVVIMDLMAAQAVQALSSSVTHQPYNVVQAEQLLLLAGTIFIHLQLQALLRPNLIF
jgi:hypothetical protein